MRLKNFTFFIVDISFSVIVKDVLKAIFNLASFAAIIELIFTNEVPRALPSE